METQVPNTGARLLDLPAEVLGTICLSLSLRDRICLSSTCRTLWHGLVSNEDAWGVLEVSEAHTNLPSLTAWLTHHRQGLRQLKLLFIHASKHEKWQAAAQLAACLRGSPLVDLQLFSLNLYGKKSSRVLPWLGSCTALTSLRLTFCNLCCLPGVLGQLPALARLSLAWNYRQLANWWQLRQLTALTQLDIPGCNLAALPAELAALPALAELNLGDNEKLGKASWGVLQQLTSLIWLGISECELVALPAQLAALPALAELVLHSNEQLGAASEEAWAPLAQCSSLTRLNLEAIPLSRLPWALAALAPHLVDLTLACGSHGDLWAGGEATFGPLFMMLTGLTRLHLCWCLEDLPLPEQLSCLAALQDLDLSESSIQGISWARLCTLTALTKLDLWNCGLSRVPPELAGLRSLADLNLCGNEKLGFRRGGSATAVAAKWAALEQLTALTRLDASYCGLHAVPAAFAALPGLRVLDLADNPSLGRGGVEALRPLAAMTALQHLKLSGCSLPPELEVDAIPFPLHRLEGLAGRTEALSAEEDSEAQWDTGSGSEGASEGELEDEV